MVSDASGWYARLDRECSDRVEQLETWLDSWEEATRSHDAPKWYEAADSELDNLTRFEVFERWPIDHVPADEDVRPVVHEGNL